MMESLCPRAFGPKAERYGEGRIGIRPSRNPKDLDQMHPARASATASDPSTPIPNAEATAALLPGAVLLRINGFGHTTLLNRSTCANNLIAAYLLDRTLPPRDTWCAEDLQPFDRQEADARS